MATSSCINCARNIHEECLRFDWDSNKCCCGHTEDEISAGIAEQSAAPVAGSNTGARDGMQWSKDDEDIKDDKSTGRKRAAVLYPLDREAPCEWQNLRFAGGGMFPIFGCSAGLQVHRHHGPDKNTLNNASGNVHRICNECHASWHTNNDEAYPTFAGTVMWAPHDAESKISSTEAKGYEIVGRAKASRERFIWKVYTKPKDEPEPNALTDH